jgi:hypothetical protein
METGKNSIFKAHGGALAGALALLAGAALSACSPGETAIILGTSAFSYFETGKTIPDHIVSQVMNKDCSSKRLIEDGKACLDDNGQTTTVAAAPPEFCYRTLADVSCYTKPDPFDPENDEVAWPNPNVFASGDPQESGTSLALRDTENKGN